MKDTPARELHSNDDLNIRHSEGIPMITPWVPSVTPGMGWEEIFALRELLLHRARHSDIQAAIALLALDDAIAEAWPTP